MNTTTFWVKPILVTKLFKTLTKYQLSRYLSHWDICYFRKEWNSTTGTRVYFNDVDFLILDNKLNIHHPKTVEADC